MPTVKCRNMQSAQNESMACSKSGRNGGGEWGTATTHSLLLSPSLCPTDIMYTPMHASPPPPSDRDVISIISAIKEKYMSHVYGGMGGEFRKAGMAQRCHAFPMRHGMHVPVSTPSLPPPPGRHASHPLLLQIMESMYVVMLRKR